MTDQKYILVEDGWGTQKWIRKEMWDEAQKQYEEFRRLATKAGWTQEEIYRYQLQIVKERG